MGQATTDFFETLSEHRHEAQLEITTGTLRVDLVTKGKQSERWLVSIVHGDVEVSHRNANADCRVRAEDSLFDAFVRGEVNPLAALLRGELTVEGDSRLLVRFQGLFPGPPRRATPASRNTPRRRKR